MRIPGASVNLLFDQLLCISLCFRSYLNFMLRDLAIKCNNCAYAYFVACGLVAAEKSL